ncbi:glycosyltransferase [Azospirillum brasilense]|nr:glycosyltransferase [Azospirillum brasilense]
MALKRGDGLENTGPGHTGSMLGHGAVEGIRDGALVGWVRVDGVLAIAPVVELYVNGIPMGLGRADQPRPEDTNARRGFTIHLPSSVRSGDKLEVRLANTEVILDSSPLIANSAASCPFYLKGSVDQAEGLVLSGWALDQRDPEAHLSIVALHQGQEIGRAKANLFRGDLLGAGIKGNHAFRLHLPLAFGDGQPHRIDVAFDQPEGRFALGSSNVLVRPEGPAIIAQLIATQVGQVAPAIIAAGARVLEAYLGQHVRKHPWSLPFQEYRAWSAFFEAPPPDPALVSAGAAFTVVIDGSEPAGALRGTIASLRAQSHAPRRIAVLVRTSAEANTVACLGSDLILVNRQSAIQALATLLPEPDGYLVPLTAGDALRPDCLRHFAIAAGPADVMYADSDVSNVNVAEVPPHFKPDWNYDLFLSGNYMVPAWAIHRRTLIPAFGAAEWADLPYQAVERSRPGSIVHFPYVLGSQSTAQVALSGEEDMRALARHLQRVGHNATIVAGDHPSAPYRLSWSPPPVRPTVSLIVPTRDRVDLLSQCLESLHAVLQTGQVECLIVDNGSAHQETLHYLQKAAALDGVRVLRQPGPFNYSTLNNAAVLQARGDIIGFINNDVVIPHEMQAGWLNEILGHFQRRDVGGVGIKLVYDDGFVQHGGVILGTHGLADHAFRRLRRDEMGYWGRAIKAQQFSAVTAAALFVRRAQFLDVGGFNERDLPVAFNDVDLCLKLRRRGLAIVWTPHVWAFHLESASRGTDVTPRKHDRMEREAAYLRHEWAAVLDRDPFYNPNLCADDNPFSGLALPPRRPFLLRQFS